MILETKFSLGDYAYALNGEVRVVKFVQISVGQSGIIDEFIKVKGSDLLEPADRYYKSKEDVINEIVAKIESQTNH